MFYRPNFCCSCGERIDRIDWKLWTSRRFCDLCATQHTVGEFVPKAIVGVGILIGIFGFGGYLQSRPVPPLPVAKKALFEQQAKSPAPTEPIKQATNGAETQSQPGPPLPAAANSISNSAITTRRPNGMANTATEAVYYCGAATKKGTPCSRRVKSPNTRCWQHSGMPAMTGGQAARGL
jgi:hypothetical protein